MESNQDEEPALELTDSSVKETVILKFEGELFIVKKEKLLKESLYFNSLFSGNYSDSCKNEITIDFKIKPETFKTFLEWFEDIDDINNDIWGHYYSRTLMKFEGRCYSELLELLRFASFYAIDGLLNSLSYLLVYIWTVPKKLIELWLLAEELSLEDLGMEVFALCLDLFEHIPQEDILSLPEDDFDMLVRNVNLRCSEAHRQAILNEWAKRNKEKNTINQEEKNNQEEDAILSQKNVPKQKPFKYLYCFTVFKRLRNIMQGTEEAIIYSWDGATLDNLVKMMDKYKNFVQTGSQILGRGYSIYVVGGEKYIGQGIFNLYITRFCLLTQKWYKVQRLLTERRHMVAEFIDNKLIIVGGVGKYRVKLSSVHILDIHTKTWTVGEDIPLSFSETPPSCVIGHRLLLALAYIYCYDIKKNFWTAIVPSFTPSPIRNLLCADEKLFAFVQVNYVAPIKIKCYKIESKDDGSRYAFLNQGDMLVESRYQMIFQRDCFIRFVIKNTKIVVEIGKLEKNTYTPLNSYHYDCVEGAYFKCNTGCFRVLNPVALFQKRDETTNS